MVHLILNLHGPRCCRGLIGSISFTLKIYRNRTRQCSGRALNVLWAWSGHHESGEDPHTCTPAIHYSLMTGLYTKHPQRVPYGIPRLQVLSMALSTLRSF